MSKNYYFSVEKADGVLCVCISPKDYTDKYHCGWDQHLSEDIDKELNSLPFILSEDSEAMFTVVDTFTEDFVEPSLKNIQYVKSELKKLGWIEKNPNDWLK